MQDVTLPKISIVMPVLNREATIGKALQSVVAQQYPNLELIIIDGGSTDRTVNIIQEYLPYITYWHSKKDGSPSIAANMGIEKATGDLVALLMADDWYEADTLQKVGSALNANPDADIITCAGKIVTYDSNRDCYQEKMVYCSENKLALNFSNICFAVSAICCRFVRKSLYQRLGLYWLSDNTGKHLLSNDKEFLLRAVLANVKNNYVPHIGHVYLASSASSTFGNNKANIRRLCAEHMYIAENYLREKPLTFSQRFLLRYWYNEQSSRLLLYHLLDRNYRLAVGVCKDRVRKYSIIWPVVVITTTVKIICKKIGRMFVFKTKV